MAMDMGAAESTWPNEEDASLTNSHADLQVLQGDIVRSSGRSPTQYGWVCCITPESEEGHVYWQPQGDGTSIDSREPLSGLHCVDRALIPGDIVRRCDGGNEPSNERRVDRDTMGMVVGTEVFLDFFHVAQKERQVSPHVPASSLQYLVPIRLVTWVVHRADGWLGRVQSWDEDLVIRFVAAADASSNTGACRCRVRAANQKQGITVVESFYRDFFPSLTISASLQDLRSGTLECEWLEGDISQLISQCQRTDGVEDPLQRVEAVIEEVSVGAARVEWLAQVPLWRGWSTERPPRSDGCQEDKLIFLLGEAEYSSRWALGDRTLYNGALVEVCGVQTMVNVRWQDDTISVGLSSRILQLCNPDAFSFFPCELVCQRSLDETSGGGSASRSNPFMPSASSTPVGSSAPEICERLRREEQPRIGQVVRADPTSRMVRIRWLGKAAAEHSEEEEEWSAFDLQIDPEFGYRLGDAVIHCRDWEEPTSREGVVGPRVGQVVALEPGAVRVRWIDGTVSEHGPRELYRVGDEDEGSIDGSHMDATNENAVGETEADSPMPQALLSAGTLVVEAPREELLEEKRADAGDESTEEGATAGGMVTEEDAVSDGTTGTGPTAEVQLASENGISNSPGSCSNLPRVASDTATAMEVDSGDRQSGELTLDDICWEPLPTDHHFLHCATTGYADRQFARRVQREWTILCRGLPRGVWVHVYPDRMELLRACLVGPEGTPYSDALFFFDLHLPPTYPQIPPQVRFWSFGENLNPNLYENGKVCLSLLGTWSGKDSETWNPERSNLLQVLVSILGLVLNTEPYYNEPGFERERDTAQGGVRSQRYNESVSLSNYHLMLRVLRTPPVDFEHVVKRHFAERRSAILERARWLQNTAASGCSEGFRKSLVALFPRLEEALPSELPAPLSNKVEDSATEHEALSGTNETAIGSTPMEE